VSKALTLYTNPMSRGRIARWMLEETGVGYDVQYLDYGPSMKSPDYLMINPMGKVPALRHGETIVTECPAICAYLADAFPDAGLAPEPIDRGTYYRWLFFAAGPMEAAAVNKALGVTPPVEKQGMVGYGNGDLMLDVLEEILPSRGFLCGQQFTAADVYVGANIGWGLEFGSIEKRPIFEDYAGRARDRDAYRRAMALDDEAMPKDDAS